MSGLFKVSSSATSTLPVVSLGLRRYNGYRVTCSSAAEVISFAGLYGWQWQGGYVCDVGCVRHVPLSGGD